MMDMRCDFLEGLCIDDLAGGCWYHGTNSGPCGLQFPSDEVSNEFVHDVCRDGSTIAAGGVPAWMDTQQWTSTVPLLVEVGWKSIATGDMTGGGEVDVQYSRGVQTGQGGQQEFSASLGLEDEASGTLDVVSVSGKLSATISASLEKSWGVEVSEADDMSFSVDFADGVAYDAYNLSATYTAGTSKLSTVSNFVIILDDGDGGAANRRTVQAPRTFPGTKPVCPGPT